MTVRYLAQEHKTLARASLSMCSGSVEGSDRIWKGWKETGSK